MPATWVVVATVRLHASSTPRPHRRAQELASYAHSEGACTNATCEPTSRRDAGTSAMPSTASSRSEAEGTGAIAFARLLAGM